MTDNKANTEKLVVLGTGYALATKVYNTCFAVVNDRGALLVDAGGGNGILRQMEDAGVGFETVHDLFITHAHPDHLNGVVWVIRKIATMMNAGKYTGELHIYCHETVREGLLAICDLMLQTKMTRHIGQDILLHDIEDGKKISLCGYDAEVIDIRSTKLRQYGFTLRLGSGKRLTCMGDEPVNEACKAIAAGSDYLLCEAFCLAAHADVFKPYEKHHSTAADAAQLAQELGIRNLVLWHTEDKHVAQRKALYTAEAKQFFDGSVFVPDDLDVIAL